MSYKIKDTTGTIKSASPYIDSGGRLNTKLHDKRDDLSLLKLIFPFLNI